jgi:hypothetical protein
MSLSRPTTLSEHADRNERALAPGRTGLPLCRRWGSLDEAAALGRRQPCDEGGVSHGIDQRTLLPAVRPSGMPERQSQSRKDHGTRRGRPRERSPARIARTG